MSLSPTIVCLSFVCATNTALSSVNGKTFPLMFSILESASKESVKLQ